MMGNVSPDGHARNVCLLDLLTFSVIGTALGATTGLLLDPISGLTVGLSYVLWQKLDNY